jgi:hypothetical protein
MTHTPRAALDLPDTSSNALFLFDYLRRHGGTVRIAPLLRGAGLEPDALAAAASELNERRWIDIVWPKSRTPSDAPARLRDCERLCTTRFGRWRFPRTWSVPVVRR